MRKTANAEPPGKPAWAVEAGFIKSAAALSDLPAPDLPEIAFAGRSNVGKSTLLNKLAARKGLAKTSNTPGRTRMLNYFHFSGGGNDPGWYLVDMPGYGYARAAKGEVIKWTRLVKDYMKGRVNLRRLFLLIDIRRGIQKADREILKLLAEAAVSTQVVLTKADKIKTQDLEKARKRITETLKPYVVVHPDILLTSSRKNLGIGDLRQAVLKSVET